MVESVVSRTDYSEAEKAAVYRVIRERRDVRSGYLSTPVDDATLRRLLSAAHQAPSVGLMQPWRFIVVRDSALRVAVHDNFLRANEEAGQSYSGDRRALYAQLKLEGLLAAPQHLCVVCESDSERGHGLGRQSMPETSTYSVACAIQNLWLAARAEGIGVGWVSILDPAALRKLLHLPACVDLIAYLCLGYVERFAEIPDLERAGWERRADVASLVKADFYEQPYPFAESGE
ncbi:MAG TPA: 5,6-dimethylbenzimidazole synthase [Acidobacteriaceae bacterium]|jgi:5,6-dimethylbenzimidazole synthase|nr:5,6-dimethylbenzimidazole synthase [Acidobacteriaceae bacterium]